MSDNLKIEEFEYISINEANICVSFIDEETNKKITLRGIIDVVDEEVE